MRKWLQSLLLTKTEDLMTQDISAKKLSEPFSQFMSEYLEKVIINQI